jgi:hypothetical protein
MDTPEGKIKQAAFDLEAPLFTSAELADVSGLSRTMVDVWISRGLLQPTRRERAERRTKGRVRKGQGRPMFSSGVIFKVALTCDLGRHLGIGLSEWGPLGNKVERAQLTNIAGVADRVAGGNWMWAVARGVENEKPFRIYTLATYSDGEWLFDMQLGDQSHKPSFGQDVPYLVIPTWKIYKRVYLQCKKLLGISDQTMAGEDV